ncbi:MAG: hypothetical protein AB7U98_01370 [Candidatus Nitrosocosmicus sp.]
MNSKKPQGKDNTDEFEEHYLLRKIKDTTKQSDDVVSLVGYLGKADSDDVIRLYTNLEFNEYFEIQKKDILNNEVVSDQILEFGGNRIWIDTNSKIKHIYVETNMLEAGFLKGRISRKSVNRRRQNLSNVTNDERNFIHSDYCTAELCLTSECYTIVSPCTIRICRTMNWPHGGMDC